MQRTSSIHSLKTGNKPYERNNPGIFYPDDHVSTSLKQHDHWIWPTYTQNNYNPQISNHDPGIILKTLILSSISLLDLVTSLVMQYFEYIAHTLEPKI